MTKPLMKAKIKVLIGVCLIILVSALAVGCSSDGRDAQSPSDDDMPQTTFSSLSHPDSPPQDPGLDVIQVTFPTSLRFDNISVAGGLSGGLVTSILQDRQGFMWIATNGGLNKYDGYSLTAYKHTGSDLASPAYNDLRRVVEDRRGTLWIGTFGGGLTRIDRSTRTSITYQHDPDDPYRKRERQ